MGMPGRDLAILEDATAVSLTPYLYPSLSGALFKNIVDFFD
jgi:hypothetical protein